jgi:hypothetical protein
VHILDGGEGTGDGIVELGAVQRNTVAIFTTNYQYFTIEKQSGTVPYTHGCHIAGGHECLSKRIV